MTVTKIRKGDKVKVLSGKDRGKEGKILMVLKEKGKVVVEGINVVKRHVKPGAVSKEGGIVKFEKPLDASNVLPICEKCGKPTRVRFAQIKERKFRICRKCEEVFNK